MPMGKGTYGSKRGRPPAKKMVTVQPENLWLKILDYLWE